MPLTLGWDDEAQTILHAVVENDWTWDDFAAMQVQGRALVSATPHNDPVGVLVEIRGAFRLNPDMLSGTLHSFERRHPRTRWVVMVTERPLMKLLHRAFLAMYPRMRLTYFQVDTLDAGRALLRRLAQPSN